MPSFPSVRTPSVDELISIAAEFGIGLTPALASSYRELIAKASSPHADRRTTRTRPAGALSAHAGPPPAAGGEPLQRLVLALRGDRRAPRATRGQDRRVEGQRLPRRRAHVDRRLGAGRLYAGGRRHDRHPHPRCRRHDRRQGRVRRLLPRRLEHHGVHRVDPQPAQAEPRRRRLRRAAAPRWSRLARSTWPWAPIRAARCASRAAWCGLYGMKPPSASYRTRASPPSSSPSTMPGRCRQPGGHDAAAPGDGRARRHRSAQPNIDPPDYLAALEGGVRGLRIACLAEGFERPESEPVVDGGCGRRSSASRGSASRSAPSACPCIGRACTSGRGSRARARCRTCSRARRRGESAGLPDHLAARRERPRAAPPAERSGTDRHAHPPLRRVHAARLSRPLLRQGTEPATHAPRRLRRRAAGARSDRAPHHRHAGTPAARTPIHARPRSTSTTPTMP